LYRKIERSREKGFKSPVQTRDGERHGDGSRLCLMRLHRCGTLSSLKVTSGHVMVGRLQEKIKRKRFLSASRCVSPGIVQTVQTGHIVHIRYRKRKRSTVTQQRMWWAPATHIGYVSMLPSRKSLIKLHFPRSNTAPVTMGARSDVLCPKKHITTNS
jgi:hypothetical protein